MFKELLIYDLGEGVAAFSTRRESKLPYPVIHGHHVHGDKVAFIERPGMRQEDLRGYDVLVTALPGVAIGVKTADCVPVLLYDPVKRVVAAIHAGWKGTAMHITRKTVELIIARHRCNAADFRAVLGPSIGPDSFQVGEEVARLFRKARFPMDKIWSWRGPGDGKSMSGGHHIDLWKANNWLLEQAGVKPDKIKVCGIDTFTDKSFFSYRREGARCGGIINSIKLKS